MTWVAIIHRLAPSRPLLTALLLGAAARLTSAQTPEAASAPEPAASAGPVAVVAPTAPASLPTAVRLPAVSALATVPQWNQLTSAQQLLLAPLERDWDRLGPIQRNKWLNAAPLLASLPAPELTRLHARMRDWSRLTPDERRDARIAYQFAKQVDAEQRRAKWEAYQALPPEKRRELAEKAAARKRALASPPPAASKALSALPKSNIVPSVPKLRTSVAVNGSLIQAHPGASTVLITQAPALPAHQAAGEAKVVADPSLVNPKTLLPKSLKPLKARPPADAAGQ